MILDFVKCHESEASRRLPRRPHRRLPRRPHLLRVFLIQIERPRTNASAAEEHPFSVSGGVRPAGA